MEKATTKILIWSVFLVNKIVYLYKKYIKKIAPVQIHSILVKIYSFTRDNYRVKKGVTKILGPLYKRSRDHLEIDITYYCNLKCYDCNRSCAQAPTNEHITAEQIKKLIKESISNNVQWKRIGILGGEPTLHPQLFEILNLLLDYKKIFSPKTQILLVTNGYGERVKETLSKIPKEIEIRDTRKTSIIQPYFRSFNVAPIDQPGYRNADYSNGCQVMSTCGMGLTPYGYYPCAMAGGIDRVFGFDIGRKELPSPDDSMRDQLKVLCKLCGRFKHHNKLINPKAVSLTWEKAYEKYRAKRPVLTRY